MIYFEFIGMFFSIIAVLLISKATNNSIYKANILFYISNLSLLTFFMLNGIISIFIQMTFFYLFENSLNDIKFTLKPLDTFAAILAIIGSYFLAFDNYIKRNLAYNYKDINDYILELEQKYRFDF